MEFREVVSALASGEKVGRSCWGSGTHIYLDANDSIRINDGAVRKDYGLTFEDSVADDWCIYPEYSDDCCDVVPLFGSSPTITMRDGKYGYQFIIASPAEYETYEAAVHGWNEFIYGVGKGSWEAE